MVKLSWAGQVKPNNKVVRQLDSQAHQPTLPWPSFLLSTARAKLLRHQERHPKTISLHLIQVQPLGGATPPLPSRIRYIRLSPSIPSCPPLLRSRTFPARLTAHSSSRPSRQCRESSNTPTAPTTHAPSLSRRRMEPLGTTCTQAAAPKRRHRPSL